MGNPRDETRQNEWYAPKFGPTRFRMLVGLTFLPYTLMNASYIMIGSLLAPAVSYERMWLMALVYLLAVGISAHALDAMGPNKPWGAFMSRRQLIVLAAGALIPALLLGLYLALSAAIILIPLGGLELFFLLAYNLELFGGRFHGNFWFALSWGFLPALVGFAVQTNGIGLASLGGGFFGFCTAFIEIRASRTYKALKKDPEARNSPHAAKLESILKGVVACVLGTALLLLLLRLYH